MSQAAIQRSRRINGPRRAFLFCLVLLIAVTISSRQSAAVDLGQAGKVSKGLVLSLMLNQTAYSIGNHIGVTLEIKNLGPDIWIRRSFVAVDYGFTFLNQKDVPIPVKAISKVPMSGRLTTGDLLKTGETWVKQFNLDDYNLLDTPGLYKLVVASPIKLKDEPLVIYTTLVSNPVSFQLR